MLFRSDLAAVLSVVSALSVSDMKFQGSGPIGPYQYGAKVLTKDVGLYLIYYGNWSLPITDQVTKFANGIGSSSWYSITKQYYSQVSARAQGLC